MLKELQHYAETWGKLLKESIAGESAHILLGEPFVSTFNFPRPGLSNKKKRWPRMYIQFLPI